MACAPSPSHVVLLGEHTLNITSITWLFALLCDPWTCVLSHNNAGMHHVSAYRPLTSTCERLQCVYVPVDDGTHSLVFRLVLPVQELQTPELQPLSMESKAALALLKYLPLNTQALGQVGLMSTHKFHLFAACNTTKLA